ncbi:hypothetical protein FNB79_03725 [Formosa sediminum]|uniref:Lipoprotein n=1 Tax=Formosa sediminum TaxID=2594004 RepID=A0A516GNL5_9FLAO|nr:hypothetical protein [Formosa sediminum]QDO93121.1 hypothetical protein FNB79_03725 [Formosa sediminum]
MKFFKVLFLCNLVLCSITNCASQKLEKKVPVSIKEVYKTHWNSGVKGGGSGVNIFIVLEDQLPDQITLDSLYFNTFQLPLKQDNRNELLFVGRQVNATNKKYIHPTSSKITVDAVTETITQKTKFELDENECIIQYTESGTVKYFKYVDLYTKSTPPIPNTRPKP